MDEILSILGWWIEADLLLAGGFFSLGLALFLLPQLDMVFAHLFAHVPKHLVRLVQAKVTRCHLYHNMVIKLLGIALWLSGYVEAKGFESESP